jgi:hypothetical protein
VGKSDHDDGLTRPDTTTAAVEYRATYDDVVEKTTAAVEVYVDPEALRRTRRDTSDVRWWTLGRW